MHDPGLGRAGVHVGESRVGDLFDVLELREVGARREVRAAQRPAIRGEVADVEELLGAQGAVRVGQVAFAGGADVAFATGDDPGPRGVDLAGLGGLQERHDAAAGHDGGRLHAAELEERRREVHQVHEVVDDAAGLDAGAADDQGHVRAVVVEVALAAGDAGHAVVAADDEDGLVEFAAFLEFGDEHAHAGVPGLGLAHVVGHVVADLRDVGEEGGQLALEVVRVDAPEVHAAVLLEGAMGERRAEPVAERLAVRPGCQEGLEIAADLGEQLRLRVGEGRAGLDHLGGVLGEVVELPTGLLVRVLLAAVRGVRGLSGAPDLVALADMVARVAEHQRIRRDRSIPLRAVEDRAQVGPEEVLAREQRAAARRAARGGHEGVAEDRAFAGDAVDVRGLDDLVEARATVDLGVSAGVAPPVVGEAEDDVRAFGVGGEGRRDEEAQEQGGESHRLIS